MKDFGLYLVITDPVAGYERCCEDAVRAGVGMVQLRMKDAERGVVLQTARRMRAITRATCTRFIVNDDPEIAVAAGADGVHVGQDDMSVAEVRRRFPELRIVGLSTHSTAQAAAAIAQNPDYIGTGPVWRTPTKKIPDPVLGIETAAAMARAVPFPAVAIGGIDASRLPELLAAGLRNYAVVRAVCNADDPYRAIMKLRHIEENFLAK